MKNITDIVNIPDDTILRFWGKVYIEQDETKDCCWTWIACKVNGYGKFKWANGQCLAHQLSWILCTGIIPGLLYVLHKCNNKACVKPSHLYLGTQQNNVDDYKRLRLLFKF